MTLDDYNTFCGSLPHTTHVVQWGGAHVWKIGGKVFAIGGWQNDNTNAAKTIAVSFKVSELVFEVMKDQPGVRPAPYLASRGMMWLQRTGSETIKYKAFKEHLRESYRLVSLGLPKKVQNDLGLNHVAQSEPLKQTRRATPQTKTAIAARKGQQ